MAQATVLIVDDDPALRRTLQLRLREEGLRVVDADSAERALALLAVELPDLVVTDVRMGGMDGLALFDEIRRDHPLLPVIILTAHGTIADAVGTTRKGVAAYLTKPVEAATLLADLDAGATGTMTSALQPEKIRPIVTRFRSGDAAGALDQWKLCLPLINHENRQCGLRAAKVVMKEGGVIGSDHVRHPLKPMSARTRERLLHLARDLDILALKWGK